MKMSRDEQSWWLTRDQHQLLLAIFADDGRAVAAWKEWLEHGSIETMEPASMPLVPLLYRRLSRRSFEEPEVGPFKGVYRRTWYQNHLLLRDLVVILARLRRAGIKTLLPADLSILLSGYKDIGLRSLDGLEVLVDPAEAGKAADVLLEARWKPLVPRAVERAYREPTSIRFSDGAARRFELRWDLDDGTGQKTDQARIWSTAVRTSILGEETLALCPTEQLLRSRQAGCWHPELSGRWMADALMVVLRGDAQLDWNRVIEFAQPSRMSLWVHSRLSSLRNQWGVRVPADVLETIDQVPKSVADRLEYRVRRRRIPISADSLIYRALTCSRRVSFAPFSRSVPTP